MAVGVPGKGEEERLIWRFGVREGGEKRQNGGERGDSTAVVHFPNLSGSRPGGCIDF